MRRSGLTTIECLIALVVFTLGALGAVGTTALAVRAQAAGERAAMASRLAGTVLDSLRGAIAGHQGRCGAVTPGTALDSRGTSASWALGPAVGGQEVILVLTFATVRRPAAETLWTFLPCR